MSFEKSCFLSYRHRPAASYETTIVDFHETLKEELVLLINLQTYFDPQRPADNFATRSLAVTLCKSVCMVVLYVPTFFDANAMACAREFRAMELMEKERMEKLGHIDKKNHGLIIPVIYRGWDSFPESIRKERTCFNIEPYTLSKGIRKNAKVKLEISKIAAYIYARYLEFQTIKDPFPVCTDCDYPAESDVSIWFTALNIQAAPQGLPTRN